MKVSLTRYSKPLGYIVLAVSVVASGITLHFSRLAPEGFHMMWLLPLFYGILFCFTNMKRAVVSYVGIAVLNIILIGRYLVLPAMSALTGSYFHSYAIMTDADLNSSAILIIIYEMICIFFTMHYLIKRLDKKSLDNAVGNIAYDTKKGIYIIVITIGVVSFLLLPAIRERTNFLIPKEFNYYNLNTFSSFAYLLAANSLPVFFLLVLSKEYLRGLQGQIVRQIPIILVALINISIFYGPGRMSVLAQGLATVALLSSLKFTSKRLIFLIFFFTVIIVVSLSSYRWFGSGELSVFYSETGNYFTDQVTTNILQSYFGGPHLIAIAISAREKFINVANPSTFFNEILSSIIFVRQVFPPSEQLSTVLFNHLFGYTRYNSMIVPTLGQSYMYFGFLGAPALSIFFCFFLYRAEIGILRSQTVGEKYAYYLLAIWLALFPMQNLNIVAQTIFNKFLPLFLIVKANQRIKIKLRDYSPDTAGSELN